MPAHAGIQVATVAVSRHWIPAFAGMTTKVCSVSLTTDHGPRLFCVGRYFTALCWPAPGNETKRRNRRGRSPASRCHAAISSTDSVPDSLVIAK